MKRSAQELPGSSKQKAQKMKPFSNGISEIRIWIRNNQESNRHFTMVWGALASTASAADCYWLPAATSTHSNYTTHLPNSQKLTETHRKGQEKLCYFNIRHCSSKSSACDLLTPLWGGVESTFPVEKYCVHQLLEESFKTVLPQTYFRFLCPNMWSLHYL